MNASILFYFNDKHCYRKCHRIEISVNYVHYDNVLKRIYLFLRHMVIMTAAVFSKPRVLWRWIDCPQYILTNFPIQNKIVCKSQVASSIKHHFGKKIPMTLLGNCSERTLDFNLLIMRVFLIVKKNARSRCTLNARLFLLRN